MKYLILGEQPLQPAVISSFLSVMEEENLLRVLRENKNALGWSVIDLKGISSSHCKYKIKLEGEFKLVAQPQGILNPTMKEVMIKEALKLLEVGVICPIFDSSWVTSVHIVPKKGGVIIVQNEKSKLIPTRTVSGWRMCIDYQRLNQPT